MLVVAVKPAVVWVSVEIWLCVVDTPGFSGSGCSVEAEDCDRGTPSGSVSSGVGFDSSWVPDKILCIVNREDSKSLTTPYGASQSVQISTFSGWSRAVTEFFKVTIFRAVGKILRWRSTGNLQMGTLIDECLRLVERFPGGE